jgi:hypothetical protein
MPADEPALDPACAPEFDEFGLPPARERASLEEMLLDPMAVVDHLSVAQCAGINNFTFNECQDIWKSCQIGWAEAFGGACEEVNRAMLLPHPDDPRNQLALERRIKWKFVLPALLLRKPPSTDGVKARDLEALVKHRLRLHAEGAFDLLIAEYEADCVRAEALRQRTDNRNGDAKDVARLRRACELLSRGQFGRARKYLQSYGLGDHYDELILEQMKTKHPARKGDIAAMTPEEKEKARKGITRKAFDERLRGLKPDTAPGLDMLRNEHLSSLQLSPNRVASPGARAAVDDYFEYANHVVKVEMPDWFYTAMVSSRLVPARKVHPDDREPGAPDECRPVKIGGCERRFITGAWFDGTLLDAFNEILAPVQNGVAIKGGISITAFGVQAALDANPHWGVIQGDIKNGYNEVMRSKILRSLRESGRFDHILAFSHALLEPEAYVGFGNGINTYNAGFRSCEGVDQGAIESAAFFALAVNSSFQTYNASLGLHGGGAAAIIDDNYGFGLKEHLFPAFAQLTADLAAQGLQLQDRKSSCYIHPEHRDADWDRLRGNIPHGTLAHTTNQPEASSTDAFGLTVCNVPIGTESFVRGYLKHKGKRVRKNFELARQLLDPLRWPHPDIPTRQMLWLLTVACFQFQGDYWLQNVPPYLTGDFARDIDEGIMSLVQTSTGLLIDELSDLGRDRLRLPISYAGCGLREAHHRRHSQFAGAFCQSVPALIDRTDGKGNLLKGRLHLPSIVEMLGANSYSYPISAPHETLLTNNPEGEIAKGLQHAWTQIKQYFHVNAVLGEYDPSTYLVAQSVENAGYFPDGTTVTSQTNKITKELERHRYLRVLTRARSRGSDNYGLWAFRAGKNKTSSIWLRSPPDAFGFIPNALLPTMMATYLGEPDPAIRPYRDFFFGKDGVKVNPFGTNLASAALPGKGWNALHDNLEALFSSILALATIPNTRQAVNFLAGRVGEPYGSRYSRHLMSNPPAQGGAKKALGAIVPDIYSPSHPTGGSIGSDSGARPASAPAFFDVKTYQANRTNYGVDAENQADRRAQRARTSYKAKFGKLDRTFASDAPGFGQEGHRGPFSRTQDGFWRHGVIPLVVGAFGESSTGLMKLVKMWARHAASGDLGAAISPLANTDRKGGAFPIMHQQFLRAIGVMTATGNAALKLNRIHYLRPTQQEAAQAANTNHSKYRSNHFTQRGAHWYQRHAHEGYGGFQQFQNGYDSYVP